VLALLVVDYLTRPNDYVRNDPFSSDDALLHAAPLEGREPALAAGARR